MKMIKKHEFLEFLVNEKAIYITELVRLGF